MNKKAILFLLFLFSLHLSALQAQDNIKVYHAYGNAHHLVIQGRMEKMKTFQKVMLDDGWFRNVWRRLREVEGDEIKHEHIIASVNDESFVTRGDDEGYFGFDITTEKALDSGYATIDLQIENHANIHKTMTTIIGAEPLVGIISDFDDTIIVSNVTNTIRLGLNTLFKNYKQRTVVPTMLERFEKILAQNPINTPSTLFILSGSPLQLFNSVEAFLIYHHFPKHTLILKKVHGANKDPLVDQFAYKTQKIERLITLYPNMEWVMFGDSGEKDPQVYKAMAERYPKKIKRYYIRDVISGEIREYN